MKNIQLSMRLISQKAYDFIAENCKALSVAMIFLVVYCYFLGVHTTLFRDIVFVISFATCIISVKTAGRREMADYILDNPEVFKDDV